MDGFIDFDHTGQESQAAAEHCHDQSSCPCPHDNSEGDTDGEHSHHICFGTHLFATSAPAVSAAIQWVLLGVLHPPVVEIVDSSLQAVSSSQFGCDHRAPIPTLPLRAALHLYLY